MVFASVVGMLALGPVTAIADEHRLTDSRTPLGLTNGWSVLLQLPFASAEFIDWADLPIWAASGGVISGHALHHLAAGCLSDFAGLGARASIGRS